MSRQHGEKRRVGDLDSVFCGRRDQKSSQKSSQFFMAITPRNQADTGRYGRSAREVVRHVLS